MKNVLVPVAGFQDAERLAARVVAAYRQEPAEIHLLNVQPAFPGHVAMFFSGSELRRLHCEDGMRELAAARRLLEQAGVPFTCHIEVGDQADAIARFAREKRCRHIIMQDGAKGVLSHVVLGSLVNQVKRLIAGSNALCEVI